MDRQPVLSVVPVSAALISNKILSIYSDLQKMEFEMTENTAFTDNKVWFVIFKSSDDE